jgi:hypothetical protein
VTTESGVDYVFVSHTPIAFEDGTTRFRGTAGGVQIRGGRVHLWLGEAGFVAARGQELTQ